MRNSVPKERKIRSYILSDIAREIVRAEIEKREFSSPYSWQAMAEKLQGPSQNTLRKILEGSGGADKASIETLFKVLGLAFNAKDHIDPYNPIGTGVAPPRRPATTFTPTLGPVLHKATRFFVGREVLLEKLVEILKSGDAALTQPPALQGMGGVGKTQLALKFCELHKTDFPGGVYWLRSDTESNLIADCQLNAGLVCPEVLVSEQPKASALGFCRWLAQRGEFLVVLDNVDSLETIAPFREAMGSIGRLLLTTRLREFAELTAVPVNELDPTTGARLLFSHMGITEPTPEQQAEAEALSKRLGGLPLALDQAGAFLARPGITMAMYREKYELEGKALRERRTVAHTPQTDSEKYWEHESVFVTFKIALEVLERESPDSIRLLTLCALLAPDDIPEFIFTSEKSSEYFDPFIWEPAVQSAVRLALLERTESSGMIAMHRVVQDVARDLLGKENEKQWAERVVDMVHSVSQSDWIQDWWESHPLMPHWDICIDLVFTYDISIHGATWILNEVALLRNNKGQYSTVEKLLKKSIEIGIGIYGEKNSIVAIRYNNLALLLKSTGRYQEAEILCRKALEIDISIHGEQHPDVAAGYNNLALLHRLLGRYEESEYLYTKALNINIDVNGVNHKNVASCCNNLALLFKEKGERNEAESLFRKSLEIFVSIYGEDHLNVTPCYNNLAGLLMDSGRYRESEIFYRKSLSILLRFTDFVHQNAITSCLNWLGCIQEMERKGLSPYSEDQASELMPLFEKADQLLKEAESQ